MIIGAILLIFVHAMFSIPFLDNWVLAIVLILIFVFHNTENHD